MYTRFVNGRLFEGKQNIDFHIITFYFLSPFVLHPSLSTEVSEHKHFELVFLLVPIRSSSFIWLRKNHGIANIEKKAISIVFWVDFSPFHSAIFFSLRKEKIICGSEQHRKPNQLVCPFIGIILN